MNKIEEIITEPKNITIGSNFILKVKVNRGVTISECKTKTINEIKQYTINQIRGV